MFKVSSLDGKDVKTVYATKVNKDGDTMFLLYEYGEWNWRKSRFYRPHLGWVE